MRHRKTRASATLLAVALVMGAPTLARSQTKPSAAAKETARNLLIDCRKQLAQKNLEAALKSCKGAHAIMNVPSTGLDLAKVEDAMGHLVEARETALEVARFDNAANNATFTQAQTEAAAIAEALDKRIPSLVINVSGPSKEAIVEVTVDAEKIPAAALSLPLRVNPGSHTVLASAGGFMQTQQIVDVTEGQTKTVTVVLAPIGATTNKADVRDPWSAKQETPPDARNDGGRGVPAWAWIAGGIGLASAGVAVGFGLDFASAQATVKRDCPDDACLPSYTDEAARDLQSRWNRSLGLTVAGSVIGAAGIGLAIYGIAAAPKADARAARIVPWAFPGAGGLSAIGRF